MILLFKMVLRCCELDLWVCLLAFRLVLLVVCLCFGLGWFWRLLLPVSWGVCVCCVAEVVFKGWVV